MNEVVTCPRDFGGKINQSEHRPKLKFWTSSAFANESRGVFQNQSKNHRRTGQILYWGGGGGGGGRYCRKQGFHQTFLENKDSKI